jgi:hypothetical protein
MINRDEYSKLLERYQILKREADQWEKLAKKLAGELADLKQFLMKD